MHARIIIAQTCMQMYMCVYRDGWMYNKYILIDQNNMKLDKKKKCIGV